MIFSLLHLVFAINAEIYEIDTPGIIFQNIGNVYLQENFWKVTTRIGIQNYTQELKTLQENKEFISELIKNVKDIKDETLIFDLKALTQELQILINSMQDINNILLDEIESVRQTRSIFPAGGTFLNTVFGNVDENEMGTVYDKLFELSETDKQLGYSIKNNTFITEKLVKRTKENLESLSTEINLMMSKIKILARQQDDMEIRQQILLTTQVMTLVIIRYTRYQNQILETLLSHKPTFTKPELIPFLELKSILKKIESKMDNTQMLPYHLFPKSTALVMYKYFPMKTILHKEFIIFDITIPTISRNKKTLYSTHATPIKTNKTLTYIEPRSAFIILNKIQNEIGYITEQLFQQCFRIINSEYLCPSDFPIYSKLAKQCELELISTKDPITEHCIVKEIPLNTMFIKLYNPHHYYYVTPNPIHMKLLCNGTFSEIILNSTGIIILEPPCTLFNHEISITTPNIKQIFHTQEYITSKIKIQKKQYITTKLFDITMKPLKGFDDILDEVKTNIKNQDNIKYTEIEHNNHTMGKVMGIITLILIIIILCILYKFCKCK